MTLQTIIIASPAANLCNAVFAINAAESSNSFWRGINAICQNSSLQMFKQDGFSAVEWLPINLLIPNQHSCKVSAWSAVTW